MAYRMVVAAVVVFGVRPLAAAEIVLRSVCQPAGPVVRLGDLAQVHGADAAQCQALSNVELFPAPLAGQRRVVRVREVCDRLLLAGVPLVPHRFSGASEVIVSGPGDTGKGPPPVSRPPEPAPRGHVVVSTAAISKGACITPSDVRLEPAASPEIDATGFHRLEDVLGKEAVRAIPAGVVIEPGLLRVPVLVRRGEVIDVYARGLAVRIRTTARAQEDGGLGDTITVESLGNRVRFSVRVTGPREAEVEVPTARTSP